MSYIVEVAPPRPAADGKPATGPEYRAAIAKDGPPTLPGVTTLYEMFTRSVELYGDNNCLGRREEAGAPYTWLTYKEAAEQAAAIAGAMAQAGLQPHGRAGVFGSNCPEWMMAMQACNRSSVYCVPLYDSLGENAIEYIIEHSEATLVFTQTEKFATLAKALPKVTALVKTVVCWGAGDAAAAAAARELGMAVHSWEEFLALGRANPAPPVPPKPEDLCTIMYTSGTTGDPKGVMISHEAVVSVIASKLLFLDSFPGEALTQKDSLLSFLPLAHIFDRAVEELMLYLGASIGYWRGDVKGLVDDIGALRPTLFCGVPRIFDRIYAGVVANVEAGSALKRALFHWGFARKLHALQAGHAFDKAAPFFDRLVFSKVKERLGGRVRLVVSGGAPLARHVEDFLKVCMCCRVVQGYGLTETCAASFIAVPDVPDHAGTVGPPQPVLSLRLEAVPEMNYDPTAVPPRGEVCVKGPAVFSGYYKGEDKTAEVLEADGWFHTGDIGELTATGALRIIDRKKNIFKLSQGEYIAVEKIEGVYGKSALVEQVFVYGNSFESCVVAIVVPSAAPLKAWAAAHGLDGASLPDLCRSPEAKAHVLAELTATGREGKLKGFEAVRAVFLEPEPFSVDNDLLTPTFKLKRPQLQKRYQDEIDAMYGLLNGGKAQKS